MKKLFQVLNQLALLIRRFISWWWSVFNKRGTIGKLLFAGVSLCIVCFLCGLPSYIVSPPSKPIDSEIQSDSTPAKVTAEELSPTNAPEPTNTPEPTSTPEPTLTPTISLPQYTLFKDKSYQDAGTFKVIWEIIVSPDITKDSLTVLLNGLYEEALAEAVGIDDRPVVIDIKAYTSEEHATSGMAQWVGWISKTGSDTQPSTHFNEEPLNALGKTPEPTDSPTYTPTPAPTDIPTYTPTPLSREDYLAMDVGLEYREVNKATERHLGEFICWKGKVFTIEEDDQKTAFQAWYFEGRQAEPSDMDAFIGVYFGILPDVYEDDEILVCGTIQEKFTGVNMLGGEISQPRILAEYVELWKPDPLPTPTPAPPTATPTPLPKNSAMNVPMQVGQWGIKLYDIKRAKTVYFFGDPETAQGVWFMPFVEFTNNSTGTRAPWDDLDFYLLDGQGRIFEITYNEGTSGAKWQYQAGDITDDIQPGLILGIVMAVDTPEDLGDVWLRVEQDPNFVMYLGNASEIPLE